MVVVATLGLKEPSRSFYAAVPGRQRWVDRLRGVALLVAASDHLFIVAAGAVGLWRIPARPAVYVLALLSGALFRGGSRRRRLELLGAGIISTAIGAQIGLLFPDVLLVFAVAHFLMPRAMRHPFWWFIGSITVGLSFDLWAGYEVGVLLAVMIVGNAFWNALVEDGPDSFRVSWWPDFDGWRLPPDQRAGVVWRSVEWIGRHPLSFWCGHLAVLVLAVWA